MRLNNQNTKVQWLDPKELRFSATTLAGGKTANPEQIAKIDNLRSSFAQYGWLPERGPVDVIDTGNGLVTMDNRRVVIAQELGMEKIPVRIHKLNDPIYS